MSDDEMTIQQLKEHVEEFVHAREWEQFHNAKDLATAVSIEAAELLELFLWKNPHEVDDAVHRPASRHKVQEELADIVILCMSFANRLKLDISNAVLAKVEANEAKCPVGLARGKAEKYTHYTDTDRC